MTETDEGLGVAQIKRLIPHRYPVLLVDDVTELVPGERIAARKAVTVNEPWYQRLPEHAPRESYAYPVTLLIESWCQTAALLAATRQAASGSPPGDGEVAVFGGASGISVLGAAYPGTVVQHQVRLTRSLDDVWIFEGHSEVDGTPILTVGSLITALRPADGLRPPAADGVPA